MSDISQANLPPVPKKAIVRPSSTPTAIPPSPVVDPSWWRLGSTPFLVLVMVAAAADLAWPRDGLFGIGAGIGCFLAINALLLLRKDFTRGEYWFLQGLAVINMLALFCSGYMLNWLTSLALPFAVTMIPTRENYEEANVRYRNWWSFWFARRPSSNERKGRFAALRALLPLLICILIGIICFVTFLCIFASGNPVVELVWNTIVTWWNKLVEYLHISWDFWIHVLYWIVGFIWFGLYCFMRSRTAPAPQAAATDSTANPAGTTMLPYLPVCVLIGINAAFAVATSTDIAFLWFGNVPEGISQTAYLHEGATSITWASVLAAAVLILLFRRNGHARTSLAGRFFGFLLVAQTALLAVSVYVRLYHQIEDFGFTVRRIEAAEAMLLGLAGLVVLVLYMATDGAFWRYTKICLGTILLMFITFGSYSPARLAGHLNLRYLSSHPHWKFELSDFRIGRFDVSENLAFAEYVYNNTVKDLPQTERSNYLLTEENLKRAALKVEQRASSKTWLTYNLSITEDIPAAERILGRPIRIKCIESED